MSTIIKVKCNGPNKCVNEVDIKDLINGEVTTYRFATTKAHCSVRERYVVKCKHCSEGEVVITRQMIEEYLKRD